MDLLLAAQLVVLAGIIVVSARGWKEIPADARIRARAGATGMDFTVGKTAALVVAPLVGLMVVGASASSSNEGGTGSLPLLGLALLVFLLLAHLSTVRRAAR